MKKCFTTFVLSMMVFAFAFAQSTITGKIMDNETNEALIGATVYVTSTGQGTVTDYDGSFSLTGVAAGTYNLEISYTGFAAQIVQVTVEDGAAVGAQQTIDIGVINMESDAIGLAEVSVIASVAVDRRTPVAVTTIKGAEVEALVGNNEYPEILRKTPSVYVTKQGGGFGDARINVRGFNQNNVAVMINGIPVNDMENGWVYWSNWAGLADVTSNLQIQRGLGASKLAVPSVGGSINIITNAADLRKGGSVGLSVGNDGYTKLSASYSTGLSESGWAFTALASHTRGAMYADGTDFQAYSYFASLSKTFNNSQLTFTVVGAPQWHHQRLGAGDFDNYSVGNYLEKDTDGYDEFGQANRWGRKFNPAYGELDGEQFSFRRNFYHKPKAFINHYLDISDKTSLKTSAYISLGRGGGTGSRGRINNANPDDGFFRDRIFDSFSGLNLGVHDANGLIRFDDIVRYNKGQDVAGFGDANTEAGTTTSSGDGFIRRASMNSHNWYGALSTLTHEINSNLTLTAGVDLRYYKGIHYRRLENLLGNNSYLSRSNDNNPSNSITEPSEAKFFNFSDNSYKDGNNVLNYWNDGLVSWVGLFAQLEYSTDKLTAFASVNGSNQGFKRVDYFNYLDSDPAQSSDWENFLGGNIKAGANFNVSDQSNFFVNTGLMSIQPLFDNVFINFVNDVNPDVKNQSVFAFEAGYGFRARSFKAKLNAYYTYWGNRQFDTTIENANDEDVNFLFDNVTQIHTGIEAEFDWAPTRDLSFKGMLSLGNWVYGSDFDATGTNIDTQQPEGTKTLFADGLKVGDAAQTTFSLGVNYQIIEGLKVYADYYVADRLFAQFNVLEDQFFSPGGEVLELPTYSLVDAGISYGFNLGKNYATIRFNMNNVFDKWYISELNTNRANDLLSNKGFVGFGRTWNMGLKVKF